MDYRWNNASAVAAAGMLDVSDKKILSWSSGDVYRSDVECDDFGAFDLLYNPAIFGETDKEGLKELRMGHIQLPFPIVNIHYLRGNNAILSDILRMKREELESVIYMKAFLVLDPGKSGLKYKQIVSSEEYQEKHLASAGGRFLMGAEAVEAVMEKEGVVHRDGIILRTLPVIPILMRLRKPFCEGGVKAEWSASDLDYLYGRILSSCRRFFRIKKEGFPSFVLIDERRLLQKAVDNLIDNGRMGAPLTDKFGRPLDSLAEIYDEALSGFTEEEFRLTVPDGYKLLDTKEVGAALKKYRSIQNLLAQQDLPTEDDIVNGTIDDTLEQDLYKAEEEITQMLKPFAVALAKKYFPECYQKFPERLIESALRVPAYAISWYGVSDGSIEYYCMYAMYKQLKFFAKKVAEDTQESRRQRRLVWLMPKI